MRPLPHLCGFVPLVLGLVWGAAPALAGPSHNLVFHSNLHEHQGDPGGGGSGPFHYNDIWGYSAPGGDEYVLLGLYDGFAVVNVTDPYAPYETAFFSDISSIWRDVKTYGHHAYVTNEAGGGLMIVDLSDPENPVRRPSYTGFGAAHNLYIDTTTGRAYIAGSNLGNGGVRILDLTANPESPVPIGSWETVYFHDLMVQDGRLYGGAIWEGALYVLDVSNPASVTVLGTASGYPEAFTHNGWVTEDGAYVMSTDENSSGRCRMWDLSTLPNLQQRDSYKPNVGTIPHNAHIEGDYAFISFYTLGVKVLDISDPDNLVEVAAWDTWPADDGGGFHGCWGAYPFFEHQTDLIAISDGSSGLWLFTYKGPLGTVAGHVTDAGNGADVEGARVQIVESGYRTFTDGGGQYSLQDGPGTWEVEVSAFGYESRAETVTIVEGQTTMLDFPLVPQPRANIQGQVTAAVGGQPLAGAKVVVLGAPLSTETDAGGNYLLAAVPEGAQTVRATAFGYRAMQADVGVVGGVDRIVDLPLSGAMIVYDFETPAPEWWVSGNASSGDWEQADPEGTWSSGTPVQPEDDHTPSGTTCWTTGPLAGANLGAYDVDGGRTYLASPNFQLGDAVDPHVFFSRWYSTGVGNSNRDAWVVEVSGNGGTTWVEIENTIETSNAWVDVDVALNTLIDPSNLTRFRFTAQDTGNGSIIEAALDDFMIYDGFDQLTGTTAPLLAELEGRIRLGRAAPNPFRAGEETSFELMLPEAGPVFATVHDVTGRRVAQLVDRHFRAGQHFLRWDGRIVGGGGAAAGVYFLKVRTGDGDHSRKLLLVR